MRSVTRFTVGRARDARVEGRVEGPGRRMRERRKRKLGGFLLLGTIAVLEVASRAIARGLARRCQALAQIVADECSSEDLSSVCS